MITRRNFLRNLTIGIAGVIATRKLAWTNDTRQLIAASEVAELDRPAIQRIVPDYRNYNPFSPTGFNIAWVEPEERFKTSSFTTLTV